MRNIDTEFEEIYERHYDFIYRFLLKHLKGNLFVLEELTQETFLQIFVSLHKYRGECDIRTWMCSIALNTMYKYFKKNPETFDLNPILEVLDQESFPSAEEIYLKNEELIKLRKGIKKLSKKQRDVIIYRTYMQMSFKEIGQLMHISETNAKTIYHRAKESLKKLI